MENLRKTKMNNDLSLITTPFKFEDNAVRIDVDDSGNLWFNANDVCLALGLGNPRESISKHVDSEDVLKRDTLSAGGTQSANHVNEKFKEN
jgi:prophage antirepressor-like protein